jgi:hypothetical protein
MASLSGTDPAWIFAVYQIERCHRQNSVSCRSGRRYDGAVDLKRAADLYIHGWTLRQIGAELGIHRHMGAYTSS